MVHRDKEEFYKGIQKEAEDKRVSLLSVCRSRGKRWGTWGSADTCRSSTEESSCPGKPSEDGMFSPFSNTFVCPSQLLEMVNCNQSTLSHHMKILTDSGLVIARKDWKWVHYSINKEKVELLIDYLK